MVYPPEQWPQEPKKNQVVYHFGMLEMHDVSWFMADFLVVPC